MNINQLIDQTEKLNQSVIALAKKQSLHPTNSSHFHFSTSLLDLIRAINQAATTRNLTNVHFWVFDGTGHLAGNFQSDQTYDLLTISATVD